MDTVLSEEAKIIAEYNKNEMLKKIASERKSQLGQDLSGKTILCAKFHVVGKSAVDKNTKKEYFVFEKDNKGIIKVDQNKAIKTEFKNGDESIPTFRMSLARIKEFNKYATIGKGGINKAIVYAEYKGRGK